jgi:uncharacterized protein YbjQ (UPF0145 family)
MIVTTTSEIPGKRIVKTVGLARGATIRARHLGVDILAICRILIGGEVKRYTQLMAQAREEAIQRMCDLAEEMGANAVVEMRFSSIGIMNTTAEVIAYGTAVVVKDL